MDSRQPRSRIEKIRIDTLRVPPAGKAQRPFREAKGDKIAAEFDINSFGFPVVCQVEETNWVVDGQHRVYAIQKCGYAKGSDSIECEERPQTQRIRHPPRNPALGGHTLEIANEQQPEIPTRPQTRAAQPTRVEGLAQPLHEGVKPGFFQDPVQPLEERMSVARRKVLGVYPHR